MSRRFIAGARCPKCGATDTLFFDNSVGSDRVECSRCDHVQEQNANDSDLGLIKVVEVDPGSPETR